MTISGTLALQTVIGMKETVREIKKRGEKKRKNHIKRVKLQDEHEGIRTKRMN